MDPDAANLTQACCTRWRRGSGRRGGRGTCSSRRSLIGLAGGWLTAITGGIGAAFLGHSITRVAIFLATGHAGIPKARGTEDEEVERRQRTPEGWRVLGPGRDARSAEHRPPSAERRPAAGDRRPAAPGRPLRPRPVLRVALPVLRLRRIRGRRGARPGLACGRVHGRAAHGARAARGRGRCRLRAGPGDRPRDRVPRGRDADPAAVRLRWRPSWTSSASRFGIADGAEVTVESNPGPDERGDARRSWPPPA